MTRAHVLLALTCAGCSSLLGLDDNFHTPDGGGITNHVGVNGVSRITYHSETSVQTVPEDLSAFTVDAYTVDDGGVHRYPATLGSDGTFTIPDVPATDYYLRLVPAQTEDPTAQTAIWHLTSHDIDLSTDRMGKPDAAPLTTMSPITVSAATATPFTIGDSYDLYSSLDSDAVFLQSAPTELPTGATFAKGEANWQSHTPLDDNGAWLSHRQSDFTLSLGRSIGRVVEAGHVGGLQQQAGVPLPLTFTLAPGDRLQAVMAVNDAALSTVRGTAGNASLFVRATPDDGAGVPAGPQVLFATRFGTSVPIARRSLPLSISYRDPYPKTWSRSAQAIFLEPQRNVVNARTSPGLQLNAFTFATTVTRPGDPLVVPQLTAPVPAPTNILLDGAPFHERAQAPDAPIRLRWDPVAGAASYGVLVQTQTPANQFHVVSVTSATPEVTLPGGVFDDGVYAVISLSVQLGAALEPAIRRQPTTLQVHQIPVGLLYVSSTCGNGTREGAEACDTGGASATCNFDCTAPACGDGILNTAAGEVCDLGITSAECDATCHPIVCGDGARAAQEACDDGNTRNGDGCSARCDVELDLGNCGNRVLDPGEDCDDGPDGSLLCTPLCTATYCGDGVQQTVPGRAEECDDGNSRSGDGCSQDCKIERCGDSATVYPETCDDGNTTPGDGCSATCRTE